MPCRRNRSAVAASEYPPCSSRIACAVRNSACVIATGASYLLAAAMSVPYLFDPSINLLSFVFSAGIGVVFGYFPARRAARLDPIEALRHE